MGSRTKNQHERFQPPAAQTVSTRFGQFFPRVFAFAHSLTQDEGTARDIAVEAFSRAFSTSADITDDEFAIGLFSEARELCRAASTTQAVNGNLDTNERELLALVFDARLHRGQIRRLIGTTEEALSSVLLSALRKLRAAQGASAAKPSLRPA